MRSFVLDRLWGTLEKGLSGGLFSIGRVALAIMLLVTIADILGRTLLGSPIGGVVDVVELSQAFLIFAGIALCFRAGSHIAVDIVELVAAPRLLKMLNFINAAVALAVLALLVRLAVIEFLDKLEWGDRTVDLRIPLTWYWAPVVVFFAISLVYALTRLIGLLNANGKH